MWPPHIPDLAGLTGYVGVTYFKQLEGFAGGAYAITYSKYMNKKVIHTYLYHVFWLNGYGPLKLKIKIFDLIYCSSHILPQVLNLQ